MNDAEGIRNLVGTGLVQLCGGLLTAALALGVLFWLNWPLTSAFLGVLLLFGLMLAFAFRRLRPIFRERNKIQAEITGRLGESLGGVRIAKAYTAERLEGEVFGAFLNGRLDLSQAEGVLATIKATSEQSLAIAQRHLRGDLKQEVDELRSRLLAMLAQLEAGIDFVEEDIEFVGRDELMKVLRETADVIGAALNSSRTGRVLREGARVVIVGRPNVGMSSLLNRLLGDSRAIVTNTPGTTRDLIEETVHFDGCTLSLVDTAGLRETSDEIEREGMRRTEEAVRDADLLIFVLDATDLIQTARLFDTTLFDGRNFVVALNKIDLLTPSQVEDLSACLSLPDDGVPLPISTVTGEGLKTLREIITDRVGLRILEPAQSVTITNVRHQVILLRCRDYLAKALESIESGTPPECVAVDLRGAADALGEITGAITSDEVLNRIFSQFCLGK